MKILIFEDERPTALRLKSLLTEIDSSHEIVSIISSVDKGIKWYQENEMPDLVFQDIILNDGNCFDIFEAVNISAPVIFTTAFSDYAIKSFQVNSIDYIVKPYDIDDIRASIEKLKKFKNYFQLPDNSLLKEIIIEKEVTPRKRFLIKIGDNYQTVSSHEIAYISSEEGLSFLTLFNRKKFIIDYSVTDLSQQMDKTQFFQINRKFIINIDCVKKIHSWFNSRLKIDVIPPADFEIIVSRERVKNFKEWLDS